MSYGSPSCSLTFFHLLLPARSLFICLKLSALQTQSHLFLLQNTFGFALSQDLGIQPERSAVPQSLMGWH